MEVVVCKLRMCRGRRGCLCGKMISHASAGVIFAKAPGTNKPAALKRRFDPPAMAVKVKPAPAKPPAAARRLVRPNLSPGPGGPGKASLRPVSLVMRSPPDGAELIAFDATIPKPKVAARPPRRPAHEAAIDVAKAAATTLDCRHNPLTHDEAAATTHNPMLPLLAAAKAKVALSRTTAPNRTTAPKPRPAVKSQALSLEPPEPPQKIAPKNLAPLPDPDPVAVEPTRTVFHKPEVCAGGHVLCKFNHYTHELAFGGPALSIAVCELKEAFAFDYGFRGDYQVHLRSPDGTLLRSVDATQAFADDKVGDVVPSITAETVYIVEIEEDPKILEQEALGAEQTYKAAQSRRAELCGGQKPSAASAAITDKLKKMSTDELREAGAEYQQLLEARDLEDMLYAGDMHDYGGDNNADVLGLLTEDGRNSPDSLDDEGKFDSSGSESDS